MDIDDTFDTLRAKLDELRRRDPNFQCFGAFDHQYRLNPPLPEAEVATFEARHEIALPPDYRRFLTEIGDGGAGPYYGLTPLAHALDADLDLDYPDRPERLDPSRPFPHTEAWNLEFDGDPDDEDAYEAFETEYFDTRWETGIVRLANYGCGITHNLVVHGPSYGQVWVDDRANDGGIYPEGHTSFLDWYAAWLDEALEEATAARHELRRAPGTREGARSDRPATDGEGPVGLATESLMPRGLP